MIALVVAGIAVVGVFILYYWWRHDGGVPWEDAKVEIEGNLSKGVQTTIATLFGSLLLWGIAVGLVLGWFLT